mmetsp:Transcript_6441/g.20111  ORF Transcript_6441/g.20111 Transcript_6441/m.20111 type:complete len:204 (-) Transcript_6441:321-932(-)
MSQSSIAIDYRVQSPQLVFMAMQYIQHTSSSGTTFLPRRSLHHSTFDHPQFVEVKVALFHQCLHSLLSPFGCLLLCLDCRIQCCSKVDHDCGITQSVGSWRRRFLVRVVADRPLSLSCGGLSHLLPCSMAGRSFHIAVYRREHPTMTCHGVGVAVRPSIQEGIHQLHETQRCLRLSLGYILHFALGSHGSCRIQLFEAGHEEL